MLRKYHVLLDPDAEPAGNGGADSPPANGDIDGASPTPQGEGDQTPSDGDEPPAEPTGTPDDQPNAEDEPDASPALTDKPEDTTLPFHKHERFQEVIREKQAAIKARQDLETELTGVKAQADRIAILDNYLAQNGIGAEAFQRALEYLRLERVDPQAALSLMRPSYETLQHLTGERLPADLESKVAANALSVEDARELARARVEQHRNRAMTQDHAAIAQQQHEAMIQSSYTAWDNMQRSRDPDFKPKGDPRDPSYATKPDGVWELTNAKLILLANQRPPRSTQEAQRLAQEAYDSVRKSIAQFRPAKPVSKGAVGSQRSTNGHAVIKNSNDVVKAILAGRRPNELRYF